MKLLSLLTRLGVFFTATLILGFIIIVVDVFGTRVALEYLALSYPDDYTGGVSFPAILSFILLTKILFRKLVRKKAIRSHVVALTFYASCTALSILMVVIGEPDLAPVFAWTGVLGIVVGFIVSKMKKWFSNFKEADQKKDFEYFWDKALKGDTDAQFSLAGCFLRGHGTEMNHNKAVEWWKKAAEQGHVDAQHNLMLHEKTSERRSQKDKQQ